MKTFCTNSPQRGFTLIELMIAMLIGVFLMEGVIQIFLSAKQAYRLQENLSRLQENGRFAMGILTKDIRMAGYAGCASKAKINVIVKDISSIPVINTGLSGLNDVKSSDTICNSSNYQCILGTDVISFQSASSCGGQLKDMNPSAATLFITTPNTCDIEQNDVVIISNCTSADIFSVSNKPKDDSSNGKQTVTHEGNLNIAPPKLIGTYSPNDTEILTAKLTSYFIRSGAGGVPALWSINSAKAGATPEELIEGIENMQILYGVDTPDATGNYDYVPNYYVIAPSVTDWTRVVSVRINVLAVTIDNNLTDAPQSYFYNGATTAPPQIPVSKTDTSQYCQGYTGTLPSTCKLANDLRIHRVFSSTIAVRNRLP